MESKRLKRLEKNRESARECRRRRKENEERVEAQLASLEASGRASTFRGCLHGVVRVFAEKETTQRRLAYKKALAGRSLGMDA